MSFLERLHPVVRASRSGDSQRFLEVLVESTIWIIGAPALEGRKPRDLPPEDLSSFVEQAAAASRGGEFRPWTYEIHGRLSLPFFTSRSLLENFLKSYVAEVKRIIPFQMGQLYFLHLLPFVLAADEAELNPRSGFSRLILEEEREVLRGVVSGLSERAQS